MPPFVIPALVVLGVLVTLVVLFKLVWKVAEPNEALIISGLGAHSEASTDTEQRGFKIVVGRGTVVIPGFQTVRRFSLALRSTSLSINAVSNQSITLTVRAVVAFKVADDQHSIGNAARRFLEQPVEVMDKTIHELFSGHLRAIVGGMSVEDMLHNREALTNGIRTSLADDLEKLGLIVDSLQIQEIDDESGYIRNLGKPQAAAIESKARIAAALHDQEATEAEQVSNAAKAAAVRDTQIKEAGFLAETERAKAEAAQSGPLMQAQARQEVVRAETSAAELDAARQEKILDTQIRKPADAEAYRKVTLANADKAVKIAEAQAEAQEAELRGAAQAKVTEINGDAQAKATQATGDAEASVIKAKGLADAAGIKARAEALAENQDAVIAQTIAENYPEIVRAGASALGNIDNLVVLNGAQGMEDMLGKALTMGGAGLGLAQNLISSLSGDKDTKVAPAIAAPTDTAA